MNNYLIQRIMRLFSIALLIILTCSTVSALSDSGGGTWKYHREIIIQENSGESLTNYQVPVQLSGGDFPKSARRDGADIRFTDSSENKLSYWIERWDYAGGNARIWVKVPKIPANVEVKILMYYDNPSATGTSDGASTFEFFDDFEGTSLDETKWHVNHGMQTISDSVLSLSGESVISDKTRPFGHNYIFESFSKMSDTGNQPRSFLRSTNDYTVLDGNDRFEFGSWTNINEIHLIEVNDDVLSTATKIEQFPTSFEVLGVARLNTRTESFREYVSKLSNRKSIPDDPLYLQLYSWGGETHYIDWVRIRKYTSPVPTIIHPFFEDNQGTSSVQPLKNVSVSFIGEKTNVVLGEDILLKLSAVNLITKPTMHVQAIIIPPSGMSVTSSEFATSGAGQYTTTYELEPGKGRDIEIRIVANQIGDDFKVQGRIIYYFGDDLATREDYTLTLPIKVRAASTSISGEGGLSTPGFESLFAVIGLLAVYLRRKI
ncbi:MAG: DUF2341 domain-containing protein [Methanosarcinaceae archaeon]